MPTKTWVSTDGNWGTAASWSPSGAPGDGDDVILPASSNQSITAGLTTTTNLNSLIVEYGFTGDIGTASTSLRISVANTLGLVHHRGFGTFYLEAGSSTIKKIVVDSQNWQNAMTLTSVGADLVTDIACIRGKLIANINSTNNDAFVSYRSNQHGDALLDPQGAVVSELWQNGGLVNATFGANITDLKISGGRYLVTGTTGGRIIGLYQAGGVVDLRSPGDPAVSDIIIGTAWILGGILTLQHNIYPVTIANLLIMPGAKAILPDNVTVTNNLGLLTRPIVG